MEPHPSPPEGSEQAVVPPWHAMDSQAVLRRVGSDAGQGLSPAQLQAARRRHGENRLPRPPARPTWRRFVQQLDSPLILILFVAAALATALGHRGDAVVILVVVLLNAGIGTLQEGRAERSMAALRRLAGLRQRVLREGQEQEVEASELVPGDVLRLAAGDAVGADARLIEAAQLQVAEAALTGEALPVDKRAARLPEACALADRRNMLFTGSFVSAGRASAVVVATGVHTELGRLAGLAERAEPPDTPLEQRLARFGRRLVGAALALFVVVMALGLWRGLPAGELLMVAISQMVSMVPEGLPVAMTIALAVGMQRMAGRGALIRRLAAVETLGSTTVICSDKTGTLTRNEMTVTHLWLADGAMLQASGSGYAPTGRLQPVEGSPPADPQQLEALLRAMLLCNDAELLPPEEERGSWQALGDPTEAALLSVAAKGGLDIAAERAAAPRSAELPFDAEAKLMATQHRGVSPCVLIKGAPDALLRLLPEPGGALAQAAREQTRSMASQALRVLAVGRVALDALDPAQGFGALRGHVQLLGLVGQIDPPREDARAALAACRSAGVRVLMLTGDHKLTGLAIARQLGLAAAGSRAIDGNELELMDEGELRKSLREVAVFARVQPAQKLRIVQALQAQGEVVAMTGDGVNDAPALARADVGVAMGISGTEVAKSAADIVITDDSFASIVAAIEQGRVVYANLKKVILYLFATSVDEVLILLAALLAGWPLPLAAVQILWINIVTEGTLTVNLVMDPADGEEMRRPPTARDEGLVDRAMLGRIVLMAGTTVTVCLGWFAWGLQQGVAMDLLHTELFTLLAASQWFNVLNCQSATRSALRLGLLANPWLLAGLGLSVALQAAVLYVPALQALFHTVALAPEQLLPMLGLASLVLWAEELRKFGARLRHGARR